MVASGPKSDSAKAAQLHQQQYGGPPPRPQRPSSCPGACQQPPLHAAEAPQQHPVLRVSRPPLKRRSTGLPCKGLSRNYIGKSQSFCCIQDLTRNPWAGESALALAKRQRASPVPVSPPSAFAAASLQLSGGGSLFCGSLPLSCSIDEDDECLMGGTTCAARLSVASSSSDGCSSLDDGCGAAPLTPASSADSCDDDAVPPFMLPPSAAAAAVGACGGAVAIAEELSAALCGAQLGAPCFDGLVFLHLPGAAAACSLMEASR